MTVNKLPFILLLLIGFGLASLHADQIELKNGETLEGRITYESDEMVKIRVSISESIKETKILGRDEIASITKDDPDEVMFNELQDLLPTKSLMSASAYRSAIQTGPQEFLRKFPESPHVPKVEEMKQKLEEELDKVERGFVKLDGEWISPQKRQKFETRVEAQILYIRMRRAAESNDYNGYIAAMRLFEKLEKSYVGTPAFAKGLELALEIVPSLGQQVQRMYRDVEYRNEQYEKNKATLDENARAKVEAARAREEAAYEASLAADKKAGIKWVRINPRSKSSLEDYLELAKNELNRIREYDAEAIAAQAEQLAEVDEFIAKGNLQRARLKLEDAAKMAGGEVDRDSDSSYIAALDSKIDELQAEREAKAKAKSDAAESESLTKNLKKAGDEESDATENESEAPSQGEDGKEATEDPESEQPEAESSADEEDFSADAFAALAEGSENRKSREDAESSKPAPSGDESEDPEDEAEEDEEDDRPAPSAAGGGGGGFSFPQIVMGLTALLIVVIVVLKVLGIGDKKEDE